VKDEKKNVQRAMSGRIDEHLKKCGDMRQIESYQKVRVICGGG